MKKYILFTVSLTLCLAAALFLFGCTEKIVLEYTLQEDGKNCTLLLHEDDMTFELTEVKGEDVNEYSGSYSYKDGHVLLNNKLFGYRTVALVGDDKFIFIDNPESYEEIPEPCEHVWNNGVFYKGNCISYGYTEYTCLKCGEKNQIFESTYGAHELDMTKGRHINGATCTDYGSTIYTCKICKKYTETVQDTELSDNHSYEPTETVQDNGCLKLLKRLYRCSKCGVEKYQDEDSRAIGAHKDENGDGICDVCKHLKNGLPSEHADKNNDGICDTCFVKISVLSGVAQNPYGYEEDGKFYIGVYPQKVAKEYSAKDIKATGLYDSEIDVWYYASEAYVLQKVDVVPGTAQRFDGTDETIVKGETYVFRLQPLAFTKIGENKYVCDSVIDANAFLQQYAVINDGIHNEWAESTLKTCLEEDVLKRLGTTDKIVSIDLLEQTDLPEEAASAVRTCTDYSLACGMEAFESSGKKVGRYYLKTKGTANDKVKSVGPYGIVEETTVTAIRGIVPVIQLKGEE